ncbi:PpiC-type peptidyl-prolyl cis-trans isomerase [Candidatus Sulfopaludibacter sp. SbA4]|nr:PpiC-type peptidyl-prolyl cis-trans isomerase [Candidatus Sulfopaludibacter sp. SbA4]
MFDLFRSRDKAVRIGLGALLVLVALSMLTYLIPSYNTGSSPTDVVVAEIGGDQITLPDVQRLIQNTVRGRQLPPEILPNFIPQIIDNVITEHALAYEAARLGFQVTDAELADAIRQNIPTLFPDGKFVGRDMYAGFLAQQNLSIAEFEADMKRQLLITRLRDVALEGTIISPLEIEQEYRKKNEKIKIQYVKIAADKYKAETVPAEQEMQDYFKANAGKYTVPETRNVTMLIADQTKLAQTVNPTDLDLQRAYNQNQEKFRVPETVKLRRILLKTEGKPPADEAKIKAQADDLLKQVKAGGNFADLVKKYSEDDASKAANGEISVSRGQMLPDVEQAAFSLKPGESAVVKSSIGYDVLQVIQHDQGHLKSFDEVKGDLAGEWKKQRVSDLMQQVSDKAEAALKKDPLHPETVAAELNMQVVQAYNVQGGKPFPEIGASPDFDTAISTLKKGEASQPVAVAGDKIVLGVVTDVIPPRPQTFDEAKDQIKDTITSNKSTAAVQKHAQELMDKAKSMGDLQKAAKSMGLEAKTSDEFSRSGTVEGLGSASYVQEAFPLADGSVFGPVSTTDATVVGKVIEHIQPDLSKLPEQRVSIRDELKSQKGRERNNLFQEGLRQELVKQGKIKYHEDVIKRLMTSYVGGNS